MLSMNQVGRNIVELRKKYNMTQTELADQMGISFQAVSNWERGNSMPDISKLPELADIFHVSVDELLGEKSKLLQSAMDDNMEEYLQNNEVSQEEIEESIPILKPNQVKTIAENMDFDRLGDLSSVLPFLDEETLGALAIQRVEKGENVDHVLPFLDEDDIEKIAHIKLERGESIDSFLPFLEDEALEKIVLEKVKKGERIDAFLPFLDDEAVGKAALNKVEKGENVDSFLPFLNDDDLEKIAKRKVERGESITSMFPFLDSDFLKKMIFKSQK